MIPGRIKIGTLSGIISDFAAHFNKSKEEIIKRGKEDFDRLKKNIPVIKERAEKAKQRILKNLNNEE